MVSVGAWSVWVGLLALGSRQPAWPVPAAIYLAKKSFRKQGTLLEHEKVGAPG